MHCSCGFYFKWCLVCNDPVDDTVEEDNFDIPAWEWMWE